MALDDYFSNPSQDCLSRLFDAVNSMDLSGAPTLSRSEKIVMRSSERKDIFSEKFTHLAPPQVWNNSDPVVSKSHRSTNSGESYSSFEEGILMRNRERERNNPEETRTRDRADTDGSTTAASIQQHHQPNHGRHSPTDSSFSLGGSAVWVGDESELVGGDGGDGSSVLSLVGSTTVAGSTITTTTSTTRKRRSTDASSSSSHLKDPLRPTALTTPSYYDPHNRPAMAKDTHFFHTNVAYKDYQLPIKMPLSTFPEEVGDVCDFSLLECLS